MNTPNLTVVQELAETVDMFDEQAMSQMTDRELLEFMVAYHRDIHRQVTDIVTLVTEAFETMQNSPIARMMGM